VTITYQTAFLLAPASRSSLALDGASGYITQQAPDGASSQLWELVPQAAVYQIVNLADGDCLTASGSAGAQVFLWFCTNGAGSGLVAAPGQFRRERDRLADLEPSRQPVRRLVGRRCDRRRRDRRCAVQRRLRQPVLPDLPRLIGPRP